MSGERGNVDQEWSDNPRLSAWLARQQAAFAAWAEGTGQEWDFTPESLDRLEDLLRSQFSSWDEVRAAEDDPAVAVPAWYLGEVQNRHCGTVWQCRPQPPQDPIQGNTPFVILIRPEAPRDEDGSYDEEDGELYERVRPLCDPVGEIRALFVRGPENRLRDVLIRYTRRST